MKFPLIITVIFLALPTVIFAQDKVYSPLVDLSNAGQGNNVQSFEQYINFLYGMSIAVAALLAVIKIVIAGAKYMMSDVIGNKETAKSDIQGAILGLLLILSAVIILELINPQLTDKTISFPGFQSPRGDLTALPVQTVVGGQTIQQHSSNLMQGLDSCAHPPEEKAEGSESIVIIKVSACGDNAKQREQIAIFEKNCNATKGKATNMGKGSGLVVCKTQLDGAEAAKTLATTIADGLIINSTQKIGAAYVKYNGTIVTTDVNGACDNNVKSLPPAQQESQFNTCTKGILNRVKSTCEDKYGMYDGSKSNAVTCQTPKSVKKIDELTEAFEAYKSADPSRKYKTIDKLSEDEEEIMCEKFAEGTHGDNKNVGPIGYADVCIFY